MKALAVLVNYGEEQLDYLQQVVTELKSFKKYDVTVIVNSNIDLDIKGIDHLNVVKLDDYQLLPMTCREIMWQYRDNFHIFMFGENDHLFKEKHIDKHLQYTQMLPDDRISGLNRKLRKDAAIDAQLQYMATEPVRQAFLNRAAEQAAQRGLRVRGALEAMPSNIQNIMLSKQAQAATASSAEAERARAAADQQDAATRFAGLGMQRRFG